MTCLLSDADDQIKRKFGGIFSSVSVTRTIVYADDTLVIESDELMVQELMDIIRVLVEYGMNFNESKLEVLVVNYDGYIRTGTRSIIKEKNVMIYLGSLLSADGRMCAELSRRIGASKATFKELDVIWRHANLSRRKKTQIYETCVLPRLLYGLHTGWLSEAELKRLDSFHVSCLRRIYAIPPAYISRVADFEVLQRSGCSFLRFQLQRAQLTLYGHVVRLPDKDVLRRSILIASDVRPAYYNFKQRGAPRHTWHSQVFQLALKVAGDLDNLRRLTKSKDLWNHQVIAFTRREQERCAFGIF